MNNEPLINPVKSKNSPHPGKAVIMAATQPDLQELIKQLNLPKGRSTNLFMSRFYKSEDISVVGPFMGAPYAVMLLENLIAWGADRIIFFGWCGSLSSDLKTGDIIIPEGAFSDEGSSAHYLENKSSDSPLYIESSKDISDTLANVLNEKGLSFKNEKIWTTDGIYRETPEKINYFSTLGAKGVEMELSALLAVGKFRNIRVGSLQIVSDELSTSTWKPGFKSKDFTKKRKTAVSVVISAAENF